VCLDDEPKLCLLCTHHAHVHTTWDNEINIRNYVLQVAEPRLSWICTRSSVVWIIHKKNDKKECSHHWPKWLAQGSQYRDPLGGLKASCRWKKKLITKLNSIQPIACKKAQAKLNVHTASPCAYNMRSRNWILKQSKAGLWAQAKHNVHTANYSMKNSWKKWPKKMLLLLAQMSSPRGLGTETLLGGG
jgi:hypothetical protein